MVKKMSKKNTKLKAFQETLKENNVTLANIEKNDELIRIIKRNADAVRDYRHPSYVRHLLGDIIMLTFFAVLANANEWGEIETFGKQKEKWLRKYLELPCGIPTDDTIRLVNSNIDTGHFFEVTVKLLLQTVDQILQYADKGDGIHGQDILAVDGKESRGSKRTTAEGKTEALRTLNVYSTDYGICLGQKFIKEKTNEIPAAQELLPLIDMKGSIVTADAMNCQKGTAAAIIAGGGDYVLALKENHPLFYEEVEKYFDEDTRKRLKGKENCWYKSVEKEHGGVAVREYFITKDVAWYSEREKWEKLNAFGMVKKTLERPDGSCMEEERYYICSIAEDVKVFERAARGHWGVENGLHWQLDFTFQDDKNTSMAKTGAKNLQIMKKIALAVLKLVKESYGLSLKRIRYAISLNYEDEVEKIFTMLNTESIKNILEAKEKSPCE